MHTLINRPYKITFEPDQDTVLVSTYHNRGRPGLWPTSWDLSKQPEVMPIEKARNLYRFLTKRGYKKEIIPQDEVF